MNIGESRPALGPTMNSTPDPSSTPETQTHSAHVLVIDDSLVCRTQVKRCLVKNGLRVTELSDGVNAHETARELMPDVVVSDIQMPGLDGYEVCRALKGDEATRHIPVIFITSDDSTEGIIKGFDAGGTDYIRKGASEAEIVARVNTHVAIATLRHELVEKNRELTGQIELEKELREKLHDQQLQLLHNEKLASIGHLAAGVAHEINNPIGFVGSNLNTLDEYVGEIMGVLDHLAALDGASPDETLGALRRSVAAIDLEFIKSDVVSLISESITGISRVSRIVGDLKDFTHAESPEAGLTSINDLLDRSVSIATNEHPESVAIERAFGDVPEIPCFSGRLAQAVLNLLDNATDAIGESGVIRLRTGHENGKVWFEVEDDGCGIASDDLPRVFDPFYTTKPVGQGTGLGLHLAQSVIAKHGGTIQVCSTLGEGTTFRVELPETGPPEGTDPSSSVRGVVEAGTSEKE